MESYNSFISNWNQFAEAYSFHYRLLGNNASSPASVLNTLQQWCTAFCQPPSEQYKAELARMEEVFRKMLEGAADPDEFGRMDDAFHRMLTSVCTNKYLNMSLAHVFDQSMRIRLLAGVHIWERHKEAAREHVEIIEAVKSGEKERAKAGLLSHLNASKTAAVPWPWPARW